MGLVSALNFTTKLQAQCLLVFEFRQVSKGIFITPKEYLQQVMVK